MVVCGGLLFKIKILDKLETFKQFFSLSLFPGKKPDILYVEGNRFHLHHRKVSFFVSTHNLKKKKNAFPIDGPFLQQRTFLLIHQFGPLTSHSAESSC